MESRAIGAVNTIMLELDGQHRKLLIGTNTYCNSVNMLDVRIIGGGGVACALACLTRTTVYLACRDRSKFVARFP